MNTNELWQAVLGELELTLSKPNFTTWFKNTFIANAQDGEAVVCVPNTFTKAWLEKKYHTSIVKSLQHVTNGTIKKIVYRVETKITPPIQVNTEKEEAVQSQDSDVSMFIKKSPPKMVVSNEQGLNPRYTFENFIVGKGNELAHAAAQAIVQSPGTTYNPLFVYGGVGLGKTHLIQAIGHALLQRNNRTRILYASCEKFTNDFIHAVRSGRAKEFKDTYRNVDVLLIDDIQFITGKEGTQEEFFHTFNALHDAHKQIIICSDRTPKDISNLEERLVSRFGWGLITDVQPPDFETRVAILKKKIEHESTTIPDEVIFFIAQTLKSNIRELEGALIRVLAYSLLENKPITLALAKEVLKDQLKENTKTITIELIQKQVSDFYHFGLQDLKGSKRDKNIVLARQVAMYFCRELTSFSFPEIGGFFGGKDHTTVLHSYNKIKTCKEKDSKIRHDIEKIMQLLKQ
ncbi:MAG TPA: chromosomal replication initiator protein DnaA [Candidatus Omnitrophica bacterium]|nr:chromosomal replication initiator protein DnaA [Candidatus Omnitrophota bacterium]